MRTTNPEEVKKVLELLIADQGCKSIDEQQVLNYELLFKDPEFGPRSSIYNPVYFEGDVSDKQM